MINQSCAQYNAGPSLGRESESRKAPRCQSPTTQINTPKGSKGERDGMSPSLADSGGFEAKPRPKLDFGAI